MKAINVSEVCLSLVAELRGEIKSGIVGKQVLHINNRGKITELVLRNGGKITVKGSVEEIKTVFLKTPIAISFKEAGLSDADTLWCLRYGFNETHIEIVDPSRRVAWHVSGTYFGSGSYNASFKTNGTVERGDTKDTGFAIEEYFTVELGPYQYLIQYQYASPGAKIKRIYAVI